MKIRKIGISPDGGSKLYRITFDDGKEEHYLVDYKIGSSTYGQIFNHKIKIEEELVTDKNLIKFIKEFEKDEVNKR